MKVIIAIIFCLILPFSVLIKPIIENRKEKKGIKQFFKDNKIEIILFFVLIVRKLS